MNKGRGISGTRRNRLLFCLLMLLLLPIPAAAQRRVTPVPQNQPTKAVQQQINKELQPGQNPNVVHRHDAQGNVVLIDTVTGREFVDSVEILRKQREAKRMIYPLWHAVSVGVDVWDPIMRVCGQKYGIIGFWADVSIHNRYKPTVEVGLGSIDDTPADMNYTYKTPMAPYFKVGMKYNFLYNSSPDYQAYAQLMFGVTHFKWRVDDITTDPGYWDDPSRFAIPERSDWASYMQVSFGLRVKIAGPLSAGWALNYHFPVSLPATEYGNPMYIPGWGKKSSRLNASISFIYTLPLRKR